MALPLGQPVKAIIGRIGFVAIGGVAALNKASYFRAEKSRAAANGGNGFDQLLFHAVLQNVAAGAFANGPQNIPFIGVHAEHEDGKGRQQATQLGERFQAVEAFHADIEKDEIGLMLLRHVDGFGAGTGLGYDAQIGLTFQNAANALAHQCVVIGQQNAASH